jgi:hypothetical protein
MRGDKATLLVRCRFPTGKGNRVRVVIDGRTAGGLDCPLRVNPGEHQVRVTSWGLPLCGVIPVSCPAGASVELALKVWFSGLVLGIVVYLAVLSILGPLAAVLSQRLPGYESVVAVTVLAAVLATILLDFYVLLPAFSVYTFRLVQS